MKRDCGNMAVLVRYTVSVTASLKMRRHVVARLGERKRGTECKVNVLEIMQPTQSLFYSVSVVMCVCTTNVSRRVRLDQHQCRDTPFISGMVMQMISHEATRTSGQGRYSECESRKGSNLEMRNESSDTIWRYAHDRLRFWLCRLKMTTRLE
jgi:hypothetical protein